MSQLDLDGMFKEAKAETQKTKPIIAAVKK